MKSNAPARISPQLVIWQRLGGHSLMSQVSHTAGTVAIAQSPKS